MHLVVINTKDEKGKITKTALLQNTYKEKDRTKTKTLAKLIDCSEEEIRDIQQAFQHKDSFPSEKQKTSITLQQKTPMGAVWAVKHLAEKLGITTILGTSFSGKLALLQILSHILEPTLSPLSKFALQTQSLKEILCLPNNLETKALQKNLEWIAKNKTLIEKSLFHKDIEKNPRLFFYDLSESYYASRENPLEIFSHESKQSITHALGLLCDQHGKPISLCLPHFKGQNSILDTALKISSSLKAQSLTIVSSPSEKTSHRPMPFPVYHISQVNSSKIKMFLKEHLLSNQEKANLTIESKDEKNYILHRDPSRIKISLAIRLDKQNRIEQILKKQNQSLKLDNETSLQESEKTVKRAIRALGVSSWLQVKNKERQLFLQTDEKHLESLALLDGYQILETDTPQNEILAKQLIQRYLGKKVLEEIFYNHSPTFQDMELNNNPIGAMLQGHAILLELAYFIYTSLEKTWLPLGVTPEEGLKNLSSIYSIDISDKSYLPKPPPPIEQLLDLLNLTFPKEIDS